MSLTAKQTAAHLREVVTATDLGSASELRHRWEVLLTCGHRLTRKKATAPTLVFCQVCHGSK
jgi:hypothetical protein